jgi:hypothetical protein
MFGTIEVGMNPAVFGAFMTVTAVSSILIATWLSHRSDTQHSRREHAPARRGSGGMLGYTGLCLRARRGPLVLIGSLALGVASITFAQLFAHARETLGRSGVPPAAEAPLYMNMFRMFFALAWTVGPAAAAWTLHLYSYRGLFLVAALLQLVFLLIVGRLHAGHGPARGRGGTPAGAAARSPAAAGRGRLVRRLRPRVHRRHHVDDEHVAARAARAGRHAKPRSGSSSASRRSSSCRSCSTSACSRPGWNSRGSSARP